MKYEVISSRIESQDEDELTAVVMLRREDGTQAEVWACAGIEEWKRGEVSALTINGGTFGTSRGYESSWVPGDSPDCWCPAEFQDDMENASAEAENIALQLWLAAN
jgi:hypothetical protein